MSSEPLIGRFGGRQQAEDDLLKLEERFGMSTERFLLLYNAGHLGESEEALDWLEAVERLEMLEAFEP